MSESSVITKRTSRKIDRLPTLTGKLSNLPSHQVVQVHQFAALAFPAHPQPLARVVDAVAMQQKERAQFLAAYFLVQTADQVPGEVHQRIISFQRLRRRIGKVG